MERAIEVIPALRSSEIAESMNGLFSSPLTTSLMGEWSGLKGFWVAEAVWTPCMWWQARWRVDVMASALAVQ